MIGLPLCDFALVIEIGSIKRAYTDTATCSRLKKMKSRSGCKGRGNVFLKSPTSRRLKSLASCLFNMRKRLVAKRLHRSPNDRRLVAD